MATLWGYEATIQSGITIETSTRISKDFTLLDQSTANVEQGKIVGIVVDTAGIGIENLKVFIDKTEKYVTTDLVGRFTIDSVPTGIYSLWCWRDGYDTSYAKDIDIWGGETITAELELTKPDARDVLAEGNGGIKGVVVSAESGMALSGCKIMLNGDQKSYEVKSDFKGDFFFQGDPGQYSIKINSEGFDEKVIKNIPIVKGQKGRYDIILEKSGVSSMEKMNIRGVAIKSSNAALLKDRQKSLELVDAIGADQFKKSGASDAADAIRSVTGVTIVNDKYVVIRGLPPKYSIVMLNETVVPSSDPDEQAVHMDMFPAGIIDNIKVYKTFRAVNPANFAGGIVDINTKPFPEEETFTASLSGNYNSVTTFYDEFLTSDMGSMEWAGFAGSHRDIPDIIGSTSKDEVESHTKWANGNSVDKNISKGREESVDFVDEYSRSVSSEMTPHSKTALPNVNAALSYGNSKKIKSGVLGYNLSFTYKNERKMKLNSIERSYGIDSPDSPLRIEKDFLMNDSKEKGMWSFLANSAYKLNDSKISFDYLFLKSGENRIKSIEGMYPGSENDTTPFYASRMQYIDRSMNYVKLAGDHTLFGRSKDLSLYWQGSLTNSKQDEPDQRDIYNFKTDDGEYLYVGTMAEPSHAWRGVESKMGTGDFGLKIPFFQWGGDSATITVGAAWQGMWVKQRIKRVKYDIYSYYSRLLNNGETLGNYSMEHYIGNGSVGVVEDSTAPSGKNWGLTLLDDSRDVAQRNGTEQVIAQYGQLELPLTSSITSVVGVRGEYAKIFDQTIVEEKQVDSLAAQLNDYDILPSIGVTAKLSSKMVVKANYGKTLVRPTIRQKAEYYTESFTGGGSYVGNKDLQRSFIHNVDLRWELFPKSGDLFAIGSFYKHIQNPIEETFLDNDVTTPVNSSSNADIFGVEFEFIKLWKFAQRGEFAQTFEINSNLTLVKSIVELDKESRKLTNYFPEDDGVRPFQGQSPIVLNLFLIYGLEKAGVTTSFYYNVFGTRLGALTAQDVPYLWEKPYHQLNFTASKKIGEKMTIGFKIKNILNSGKVLYYNFNNVEYIQHESHKGLDISLGLKLKI